MYSTHRMGALDRARDRSTGGEEIDLMMMMRCLWWLFCHCVYMNQTFSRHKAKFQNTLQRAPIRDIVSLQTTIIFGRLYGRP